MVEYAQILSHNVLDGAIYTGDEVEGHELDRLADGYRHTWWEAPNLGGQEIILRVKNLIYNPGFEVDTSRWLAYVIGGGVGTITRNTTSPLSGIADVDLTATVADAGAAIVCITAFPMIFMRANRTYRMMFLSKASGANKNIRFGFLKEDFSEDSDFYSDAIAQNGIKVGHYKDVTPTSDGWYRPFCRIKEAGTVYLDDFVSNEIRDVNTIIIDIGHTLQDAIMQVLYRNTEHTGWIAATAPALWYNEQPLYWTFTGVKALSWKITINQPLFYPDVQVAKIPLLYLGKRWEMPHQFIGAFDPYASRRVTDMIISERGIVQDTLNYHQRTFKAALPYLTPVEYKELELFYEDTNNGLKPFFFIWKPTSFAWDIIPIKIKGNRLSPYSWYNSRSWTLNAEELIGARKI